MKIPFSFALFVFMFSLTCLNAQSQDHIKTNKEFLTALNTGNFLKARDIMKPTKRTTPEKLEKSWTKFSSRYGKLTDIDSAKVVEAGQNTFVNTYAKLENGTAFLVTTFDENKQIVGIHAYKKRLNKARTK